jgi:anti-sigma factor RsiW
MTAPHDIPDLGAYALGALDPAGAAAVERHLAGCPRCRAEVAELRVAGAALDELPPEAFLDGPPPGGDLLLARTLRQVRAESGAGTRRRRLAVGAVAAALIVVVGGAGVLAGRVTAPDAPIAAPPVPTQGAVTASADQGTVRMASTLTPAKGWVRVSVNVVGIPAGERCRLIVVAQDGSRHQAGSWLVSEKSVTEGTRLDGSALVAPDQVRAIEVENESGQTFVSVPI